jgi:hypothetical protein
MADLRFPKGLEVHSAVQQSSTFNPGGLGRIHQDPHGARPRLRYADMTDSVAMPSVIQAATLWVAELERRFLTESPSSHHPSHHAITSPDASARQWSTPAIPIWSYRLMRRPGDTTL